MDSIRVNVNESMGVMVDVQSGILCSIDSADLDACMHDGDTSKSAANLSKPLK